MEYLNIIRLLSSLKDYECAAVICHIYQTWFFTLFEILLGCSNKEEWDGHVSCVMHWEEKLLQGFGWKIWKKLLGRSEFRW